MKSIIFGIVLVIAGVSGITVWWWDVFAFLRGFLPVAVLVVGGVAIFAGLEMLKKPSMEELNDSEGIDE